MTIPKDIASEIADIGDEYIAAEMLIIEAVREFRGASTRFRARKRKRIRAWTKCARVSRTKS